MDLVILSIFIVKIPFPKNLKLVDDERYYKKLSFNGFRLSRHFKNCNKPWRNFFENVVLSKMKVFFVIVVFVIGLVHSINLDIMATYNKKYLKRV